MSSGRPGLAGKVAIVTGSTAGIGFAIAERLAREGAQVIVSSRKKKNVDDAVAALKKKGLAVEGIVCHVGVQEDRAKIVRETVSRFGKIDILVSNVACNPVFGPMVDATDEKSWDKIFDLNVKAAFLLIKQCIPHIPPNGSIVLIASYAAYNPNENLGAYSVSKTALVGLTKVLAKDLASKQIRVNCVAPGLIETQFSEAIWKNDTILNKLLEDTPLKRMGKSWEIAGPVAFLVSDDSSFVTGETLCVTGGVSSRL